MKSIILATVLMAVTFTSMAGGKNNLPADKPKGKTFVLVHGAWMAPYAWDKVAKGLEKDGQKVIVIELPGHGADQTEPSKLSLDVYRDKVIEAINAQDDKVILVGHSLAGMVISEVAEAIPAKIEKLVYLGAYLPASGQSLLAIASTDGASLLGKSIVPSADQLTLDVKKENLVDVFCADSTPEVQALVVANYKAEPAIPFTNKVTLTDANYGGVSKYYIHTLQDHAISIGVQNSMVAAAGLKNVYSLDSSHTPFLSMPEKVTALLLKISK